MVGVGGGSNTHIVAVGVLRIALIFALSAYPHRGGGCALTCTPPRPPRQLDTPRFVLASLPYGSAGAAGG